MVEQPSGPIAGSWSAFQQTLRRAGHRRLVLLEGDRASALGWLDERLKDLHGQQSSNSCLWVGQEEDAQARDFTNIRGTQARRWLGRELDCIVWDGWQGNAPEGLAALSGTLSAGGLLFWLMPPLSDWAGFSDPDYQRVGLDMASSHAFAARLARVLENDASVIRVNVDDPEAVMPPLPLESPATPFEVKATEEQRVLVDTVVRTGMGRRRRPLVITADRGRGKSAALGIGAARLLQRGRKRILVTAPEKTAVDTLFRHARQEAGDADLSDGLQYLPVDELLTETPEAELVIVDEAAAIPPHRLKQILLGWPRVVFASTVHGYEGAGRGFSVRFRGVLDRETPHWKKASLTAPIRWSESDPLEPLTSQLFLLNAQAPEPDTLDEAEPVIQRWNPATASDKELSDAFGLLVDAHYRTSPADLRQWMDDPRAVSWTITLNGTLAGVLWATEEGGLAPELAQEVMLGRRRIRGHLLAQSLASHSGFAEAAEQKVLRVVRIAVNDQLRTRGLGKALVDAARQYTEQEKLDALGTSFGGEQGLLSFWQSCGLAPVRLGMTREASSGEVSLQMLAGASDQGKRLTNDLQLRLFEHWPVLVPLNWPVLEPELLLSISASLAQGHSLNEWDWRDLSSFAFGHRGFDLTLPALRKLSLWSGFPGELWQQDARQQKLWCRAVLQGWSWRSMQAAGLCDGREQGEGVLRDLVGKLLQNPPDL